MSTNKRHRNRFFKLRPVYGCWALILLSAMMLGVKAWAHNEEPYDSGTIFKFVRSCLVQDVNMSRCSCMMDSIRESIPFRYYRAMEKDRQKNKRMPDELRETLALTAIRCP